MCRSTSTVALMSMKCVRNITGLPMHTTQTITNKKQTMTGKTTQTARGLRYR